MVQYTKIKRITVIFSFVLVFLSSLSAQLPPAQFSILNDSTLGNLFFPSAMNEEGTPLVTMHDIDLSLSIPNSSDILYLVPLDELSSQLYGLQLTFPPPKNHPILYQIEYRGDKAYLVVKQSSINGFGDYMFGCVDLETNEHWFRMGNTFVGTQEGCFGLDEEENMVVGGSSSQFEPPYMQSPVINLSKYDSSGDEFWRKAFLLDASFYSGSTNYIAASIDGVHVNDEKEIFVEGELKFPLNSGGSTLAGTQFLMKLDSLGNPVKWLIIDGARFTGELVTGDGYYLKRDNFVYDTLGIGNSFNSLGILKLDFDLNVIWSKSFHAENFGLGVWVQSGMYELSSGNIKLGFGGGGLNFFPAVKTNSLIVLEIDKDGNIIEGKGYPHYSSTMAAGTDGSLIISSSISIDSFGQENRFDSRFTKTDVNGEMPGCVTFPACVWSEDFEVIFGELNWEEVFPYEFPEVEVEVEPRTFDFEIGCDYETVPDPKFNSIDTICVNENIIANWEGPYLTNKKEWLLSGPAVDSILVDSSSFEYYFSEPGEYLLSHTIWLFGCPHIYEKIITVLAPPVVSIGPEYICPDGPFELGVESERELREYMWNTGETTSVIPISSPGIYSVEISDGFCEANDTTEIKFVSDIIGVNEPIILPEDTTVCEIHLPHEISPSSPFSDLFSSAHDPEPSPSVTIPDGLPHPIFMEAYGCLFEKEYVLDVSSCEVLVYVPTIFSPNNDGINDLFFPMGKDFLTIELTIYDRWGGRRYHGEGASAAWDGGTAVPGTYLFHLTYLNQLTGLEEKLSGEVALTR